MSDQHCMVAMSGGVDSSVAAFLMQQAGYLCKGVTMQLLDSAVSPKVVQDQTDAAWIAKRLNMPFEILDCQSAFRQSVIETFIRSYQAGNTPNPCITCNRTMKFGLLMEYARAQGADVLATGHYARVRFDEESGRWQLLKAVCLEKDQSYVLSMLTQEQLAHLALPLGDVGSKDAVRTIAEEHGLVTAHKSDSQDICFIPQGAYADFIIKETGNELERGPLMTEDGTVVGEHEGALRYTIGQRKGIGVAMGEPYYVCDKNMERNEVVIGPKSSLFASGLLATDLNWISIPTLEQPMEVEVRTHYHQPMQKAEAYLDSEGMLRVEFAEPQRAISPGQAVVLYQGEVVVGGGTILSSF